MESPERPTTADSPAHALPANGRAELDPRSTVIAIIRITSTTNFDLIIILVLEMTMKRLAL